MAILLVEDDETRVDRIRLEVTDHEIEHVDSVEKAVALLKEKKYDLVLLDHDLEFGKRVYIDPADPNTGYHVAKYVHEHHPDTPVVVHSFNWFGANRIVKEFPNAVYVPFGLYPPAEVVRLFLDRGLKPDLEDLDGFTQPAV